MVYKNKKYNKRDVEEHDLMNSKEEPKGVAIDHENNNKNETIIDDGKNPSLVKDQPNEILVSLSSYESGYSEKKKERISSTSNNHSTNSSTVVPDIKVSSGNNKTSSNTNPSTIINDVGNINNNTPVSNTNNLNGMGMDTNYLNNGTIGTNSSTVDNQYISSDKSMKNLDGTIVVIVSIGIVAAISIICIAYFIVRRKRKLSSVRTNSEGFAITVNDTINVSSGDDSHEHPNQTSINHSSNAGNMSPIHPLPPVPATVDVNQEINYSNSKYQLINKNSKRQCYSHNDVGSSKHFYPNNQYNNNNNSNNNGVESQSITNGNGHYSVQNVPQFIIDSNIARNSSFNSYYGSTSTPYRVNSIQYSDDTQYHAASSQHTAPPLQYQSSYNSHYSTSAPIQYPLTPQSNNGSPLSNHRSNRQSNIQSTSPSTPQSVSNAHQHNRDSLDHQASTESSYYEGDFDAMDDQMLSQSSKYLYDSMDNINISHTSRSIFDSIDQHTVSQSNKYLLSQSAFDSSDNQSSHNYTFDPNNSSIDIYATEAVISLSEKNMNILR